jgi:hypothetical protein
MEIARMALLGVALLLLAFTLGAVISWRLEGRQRRVLPLWLVITQNVSWLALVAYLVTGEPPSGVITIDPLMWNVGAAAIIVASLLAFALEVRHSLSTRLPA